MALAITATAEVSPAGVPRVALHISGAVGDLVTVYRTDSRGVRTLIRQGNPASTSGGVANVYDYESPFGDQVKYSVVDSNTTTTATSVPVTVNSSDVWLIHPGQPESSVRLHVMEWPNWTRPIQQEAFQPVAREARVVVSSVRGSPEGELVTYTEGSAQRNGLLSILSFGTALLIKGTATESAGTFWVSVGELGEDPMETDLQEFSVWTLPLVVVDPPAGRALPPITYAETSGSFFTYADARQKAPTYQDRSAGTWM